VSLFFININLYNCSCKCILIVCIVYSVSFVVCVILCAVFCLSVMCYFVWSVLLVVALPPGKNPFAVKININKFVTSSLDEGRWSVSNPGRFCSGQSTPDTRWAVLCRPQTRSGRSYVEFLPPPANECRLFISAQITLPTAISAIIVVLSSAKICVHFVRGKKGHGFVVREDCCPPVPYRLLATRICKPACLLSFGNFIFLHLFINTCVCFHLWIAFFLIYP
jgi:hypothetical protein